MYYARKMNIAHAMEQTAQDNRGMERQLSEIEERLRVDHVDEHARDWMLARVKRMWSYVLSGGEAVIAIETKLRIRRAERELSKLTYSQKSDYEAETPIEQQGRGPDIKAKRAARVSNRRK